MQAACWDNKTGWFRKENFMVDNKVEVQNTFRLEYVWEVSLIVVLRWTSVDLSNCLSCSDVPALLYDEIPALKHGKDEPFKTKCVS